MLVGRATAAGTARYRRARRREARARFPSPARPATACSSPPSASAATSASATRRTTFATPTPPITRSPRGSTCSTARSTIAASARSARSGRRSRARCAWRRPRAMSSSCAPRAATSRSTARNPPRARSIRSTCGASTSTPGIMRAEEIVAGGHCLAPDFLADQIARSRANLGVETIDLYYLHNPEQQLDVIDDAELERRIRAGLRDARGAVRSRRDRRLRMRNVERAPHAAGRARAPESRDARAHARARPAASITTFRPCSSR